MHSRFRKPTHHALHGAAARLTEMPMLAAPRPVKALPERCMSTEESAANGPTVTLQVEKTIRAIALRAPDRHLRSLGYGIDE